MITFLTIPWFKLEPIELWAGLKIQPFGVMAAIAILVGARFARRRAEQLRLSPAAVSDFLLWTTLIGLVCAYSLNAVLYHPRELLEALADPGRLVSRYWGLSSYGGFFGGAIAGWILCRRPGLSLASMADVWCFAIPFAGIFARGGCLVVHDHPGGASEFVLAVADYDGAGVARHDLGLYEVLWSIAVSTLFLRLSRRPRPVGYYLGLIPLLYGPFRFVLDFLRIPEAEGGDARYLGLTPAQYFSLVLTLIGVALLVRRRAPDPGAATAAAP